jgi:ADP-heptose:LPS heptosyltransferase
MVDNVVAALNEQFHIPATNENGLTPPPGLIHRHNKKRVVIHSKNAKDPWPEERFQAVADWLEAHGYEPYFLPIFPTLEELANCIYESGYFIGNDSGPGHLASALNIPNLIIGRDPENMRLWRPGWLKGEVVLPLLNWKPLRKYWKKLITTNSVISKLKSKILIN